MEVMESNKKQWVTPRCTVQQFETNEYISACGVLEDGTVLYAASIRTELAYNRIPNVPEDNDIKTDEIDLESEHPIYFGSFYWDKELTKPDATANGHEEYPDWEWKECVQFENHSPWGYHYHFKEVTNRS